MMGVQHGPFFLALTDDLRWVCDEAPMLAGLANDVAGLFPPTPDKGNPFVASIDVVAKNLGGHPVYPARDLDPREAILHIPS